MKKVAIVLLAAAGLAGCGHREKKAPCAPMVSSYAAELSAPAPFNSPQFRSVDECGPAKPVNQSPPAFGAPKG